MKGGLDFQGVVVLETAFITCEHIRDQLLAISMTDIR